MFNTVTHLCSMDRTTTGYVVILATKLVRKVQSYSLFGNQKSNIAIV